MTMKAKDLMIGDLVLMQEGAIIKPIRVMRLVSEFGEEDTREISPIPLTGEILEKNGFYRIRESPFEMEYRICVNKTLKDYLFVKIIKRANIVKVYFNPDTCYTKIDYIKKEMSVHDLQHAMRMCGIEKEIQL